MISLLSLFYTNQNALRIFTYVFVCFCTIEVRIPIWYCHLCDLLSFFCVFFIFILIWQSSGLKYISMLIRQPYSYHGFGGTHQTHTNFRSIVYLFTMLFIVLVTQGSLQITLSKRIQQSCLKEGRGTVKVYYSVSAEDIHCEAVATISSSGQLFSLMPFHVFYLYFRR